MQETITEINFPRRHSQSRYEPELIVERKIESGKNVWTLSMWDLHSIMEPSHHLLAYQLNWFNPDLFPQPRCVFRGQDFGCPRYTAVDSKSCVGSLCMFLSLKPGDTDAEYFAGYNDLQKEFLNYAEEFISAIEFQLSQEQDEDEDEEDEDEDQWQI